MAQEAKKYSSEQNILFKKRVVGVLSLCSSRATPLLVHPLPTAEHTDLSTTFLLTLHFAFQ